MCHPVPAVIYGAVLGMVIGSGQSLTTQQITDANDRVPVDAAESSNDAAGRSGVPPNRV